MPFIRLRVITILIIACAITAHGNQASPPNRPWPPDVQRVPDDSPALSPDDALKTFYMPPGYRVELVASEPLIQEPVAIDWDTRGRLWAVEMPGFMKDAAASGEHDPIGRVVVLEDTNDDGRMDRRTVFADGLVLARSIKVLERGVLVAEPPNLWLMRDTDGDLRMDAKELVTDRFGRRDADPENNANGFDWSLDNRMYTAGQADVDLRLEHGAFEVRQTLVRGEWGVTHDDAGRTYRNTNESALHVDLVPTAYYARNPDLLRTRGSYERLATDENGLNTVWPVRPNPGTNRAYQMGIDRADGTLARFTAVCAPLVYRGDRLPRELYGDVFVAEPAGNLVSRITLSDDGTTLQARKAYERGEFLASTDERFRPVYLSNSPDGALYVVDMYRGILEHRLSLTVYLRDYILRHKLDRPTGLGRIYRVVHESTRRDQTTMASQASSQQLVELLSHPNGWWRDTAQRLLVERDDRSVVPALTVLSTEARDPRTRLHALWTLDGIDAIEPATVVAALSDASRDVRASAVRLAERWLGVPDHPMAGDVLKLMDDPDWAVREQLAASLGALPSPARETAAAALLERHGRDPIVVDATISSIHGSEAVVLEKLLANGTPQRPARQAAIPMLAATIVRGARRTDAEALFTFVGDASRSAWQRSAVLQGAEIALLGASMPGTPAPPPRDPTLPCPTCPGGRLGPGGAYAFPRPAIARSNGGRTLQLDDEPAALAALAAAGGELGVRAATVLARVTWPGKPGTPPAAAALSTEQQERFTAGHAIYQNYCQACHQADGRGREKVAPSLVGSPLALASPEIPTLVLLNGKEGGIGLMPPIGSALNDEQIAAVLTYIRRAWDQAGSPVEPGLVKDARARTAGRTRPWTNDELMTLAALGRRRPR